MHLRPALVDAAATHVRKGRRVALLVRHAERGHIADLSRHEEVLLTPAGHVAAAESGARLAVACGERIALVHSPVPRCGETAAGLGRGLTDAGKAVDVVGVDDDLGASYLRDKVKLAAAFMRHGKQFVRAWFDGDVDADTIDPCAAVAERQVRALQRHLNAHPFVVAVSHDWNIAAVREHALGLRFEDVGWPQFLDGVLVVDVDGRTVVQQGD